MSEYRTDRGERYQQELEKLISEKTCTLVVNEHHGKEGIERYSDIHCDKCGMLSGGSIFTTSAGDLLVFRFRYNGPYCRGCGRLITNEVDLEHFGEIELEHKSAEVGPERKG